MPQATVNGVRLHYEERGAGTPILCIHGTGSSALAWASAVEKLAARGRVVVYDRRGCTRSERPEPYDATSPSEHADDARELLRTLAAEPAVVVGRSYGGNIALDLALRHPGSVRALALLEAIPAGLSADVDAWGVALGESVERAAAEDGPRAVGEAFLRAVLGAWDELPGALREMFTENGAAILAELRGRDLTVDAATLARIRVPTLVVSGAESADEFRRVSDAVAAAIPHARSARVPGGHMIDPAHPVVLEFLASVASARGHIGSGA